MDGTQTTEALFSNKCPMPGGHPVEVGTALTGRPPHRSERTELPHSALASGPNAQPYGWIGMTDMRIR